MPEEWAAAFSLAEIAFLVTLTSADRVVSATAAHCLRLVAISERAKGGTPAHLITEEEKSRAANRASRVVVLKHMFTLKELEEDAALLLDLKEDVRDECENLGEVTNVVLYDVRPLYTLAPPLLETSTILSSTNNRKNLTAS